MVDGVHSSIQEGMTVSDSPGISLSLVHDPQSFRPELFFFFSRDELSQGLTSFSYEDTKFLLVEGVTLVLVKFVEDGPDISCNRKSKARDGFLSARSPVRHIFVHGSCLDRVSWNGRRSASSSSAMSEGSRYVLMTT